eukprot:scaffold4.g4703.t1
MAATSLAENGQGLKADQARPQALSPSPAQEAGAAPNLQVLHVYAAVLLAAAGAAWTVGEKIHLLGRDLRQQIATAREQAARFEGATTATLQQHSALLQQNSALLQENSAQLQQNSVQLQELLQVVRDKK